MNHEFPAHWKDGVYAAILQRRDMRAFRPDPIPNETLARILNAAHHAGSVGFMQPWNFLVIESREVRQKIRDHVEAERLRAAAAFDEERRKKYLSFKLEGILDAALNICVTCDPTRHGPEVLGRHTIRDTDVYSTCCAIQNLWLAARAEGIGVGWVSILEPQCLRDVLGIPGHVVPVAYLCVGCVDSFPAQPMLETANWLPKLALAELVYRDQWGAPPDAAFASELHKSSGIS
jgi:5,6-dimethylbenzimidazole synthase